MGKKSERRERRIALARARDAAERGAEAGQWIRSAHKPLQVQAPAVGDAPMTQPTQDMRPGVRLEALPDPGKGAEELQPLGSEPRRTAQRDPRAAIARRAHGSRLAMLLAMTASLGPGSR
jgi:hypothetical protein